MSIPTEWEQHRQNFLEAMKVRRYSPATLKHRRDSLTVFFRWLAEAGVPDLRAVTRQNIKDYLAALLKQYRIASGQAHLISVRRFFEHLENTDTVLVSPCGGVLLPHRDTSLPRAALTPKEARRILNMPDTQTKRGLRNRAILEVFYSTGIRLEEMSRLSVHDVDYRNGFVRVKGKGNKERIVPIGRRACDYVSEYLRKVRAEWSKANREERALWLSHFAPHPPLKWQMIGKMVTNYGKAAGLDKAASPHIWRHTCATHMVSNGSNIAYVQRLLGHSSLRTTQVYTHATINEIKAAHTRAHPQQRRRKPQSSAYAPAIGKQGQRLMYRKGV